MEPVISRRSGPSIAGLNAAGCLVLSNRGVGGGSLKATEGVISSVGGHCLNALGRLGRNSCKPGIDFTPKDGVLYLTNR